MASKVKVYRGHQFKYACECDLRDCNRIFRLEHKEYVDLSGKGLVRHVECPSVAHTRVVTDAISTNEDVVVVHPNFDLSKVAA